MLLYNINILFFNINIQYPRSQGIYLLLWSVGVLEEQQTSSDIQIPLAIPGGANLITSSSSSHNNSNIYQLSSQAAPVRPDLSVDEREQEEEEEPLDCPAGRAMERLDGK